MAAAGEIKAPPAIQAKLRKLGLVRADDLVLHLPLRYEDETRVTLIDEAMADQRSRARKGEKSRPECNESFHLDILKLPAAMSQAGGSGTSPIVPQCPPPLHAGGRGQRYD